MTTLFNANGDLNVNPESFINQAQHLPAHGRGAWNRAGLDWTWRYELNPEGKPRIGSNVEKGLEYWATGAGVWCIQQRLIELKRLAPVANVEKGLYGEKTRNAVVAFQRAHALDDDGTVGTIDAKALFTPYINLYETTHGIPDHLMRGEINHESVMDPGGIGGDIYYTKPDGAVFYGGVDRGLVMNNSKANTTDWIDCFNARAMISWASANWRARYDDYRKKWPGRSEGVYKDAATCGHNSPLWGQQWAQAGEAPNATAQKYVDDVKAAIY